jgi:hypothetical protein
MSIIVSVIAGLVILAIFAGFYLTVVYIVYAIITGGK